jgi:hypothetical protein
METQKVQGVIEQREPTVLERQINSLNGQNWCLEQCLVDIVKATDRLREIGLKLNRSEHPDNAQECVIANTEVQQKTVDTHAGDGLIFNIEKVFRETGSLIDKFNNYYYRDLVKQIEFLEKHI